MIFKNLLLRTTLLCIASLALTSVIIAQSNTVKSKPPIQKQIITLKDGTYRPARFHLRRGIPAQLTIIRKSADECGEEIVFPAYGIRRRLPLNRPVVVRFTPRKKGSFGFMCGMDMMYGKIIVQ